LAKADVRKKLAALDAQNLAAARIIAANPRRYSGVLQEWARLILGKRK